MKKHARRKKLIKPGLQLKLAGAFMATALAATLVQAVTLNRTITLMAEYLPNDSELFLRLWPEFFTTNVLLTLLLIVLTVYGVGVAITHQIAGPLYRMEIYLRAVKSGEATEACRLRRNDQLHEFCDLLNEATAPLREDARRPQTPADEAAEEPAREAA